MISELRSYIGCLITLFLAMLAAGGVIKACLGVWDWVF